MKSQKLIEIISGLLENFDLEKESFKKTLVEILYSRMAETVPSKGATPGEGDIRLLAECIRLSETPIPGVWCISLLSNDSDFLWFSSDIEREFGIKIHDI